MEQEDIDRVIDDFAAAARRFSAARTREQDGRVPWRGITELPPGLQTVVLGLTPGEVSSPISLQGAVALFQLRAIEEVGYRSPAVGALDFATVRIPGGRTPEALAASLRPRVRRPSDAIRRARMVADSGGAPPSHDPPPRGVQGLSENGMVTVGTDPDGRPATVLADPDWLSAATAGALQQALLQAFQRAFTAYADTLATATGGTS